MTDRPSIPTSTLARLTGAKTVVNGAMRWIPPFLPTLQRAFGATTSQLTTVMGTAEFAGLSTILVGRHLDRGRERIVMVSALLLVALSAVIALGGSLTTFALSYVVLVLGVSNLTVAGHTWISHRVDYRWRARSLGLFETGWAMSLLIGAPLVAVLINVFGWRGPFVAVAIAAVLAAAMVAFTLPKPSTAISNTTALGESPTNAPSRAADAPRAPINRAAWLVMSGSAMTAMAGLSVFVISGSWLEDAFGVSTGGIGIIAMTFGGAELVASLSVAGLADRLGKLRSTVSGLCVVLVALVVILAADQRLWLGIIGILVFLLGFEFAIVSSFSLVSEAMPDARGATIALSSAIGTAARASGAIISGILYSTHGISGTAVLSATAAIVAVSCFVLSHRAR